MRHLNRLLATTLLAALCLTHLTAEVPTQEKSDESRVNRIYDVRWRNADDLMRLLQPFLTHGKIGHGGRFNALTIVATDAEHAPVAALLEKYDVPARMIEFQFYILQASEKGKGVINGVPKEVREVLEEVASLTRFDTFELVDAPLIRVEEGSNATVSGGSRDSTSHILLRQVGLMPRDGEGTDIRVGQFRLDVRPRIEDGERASGPQSAGITTSFSLGDGETIVIGTGGLPLGNAAIVAVLTGRVLK